MILASLFRDLDETKEQLDVVNTDGLTILLNRKLRNHQFDFG